MYELADLISMAFVGIMYGDVFGWCMWRLPYDWH